MNRESLSAGDARAAMAAILRGEATTPQITAFLASLRTRGETAEEILGLAQAMRDSSIKVDHGITGEPVLDTCGTGGDAQGTLNISTLVAFVVAGAGVKVAKHGNRSVSSRCGSADLLEAFGARVTMRPDLIARSIREVGLGFLFAPALHPAMKHAAAARAELRTRTAFNLLGPLTNPAGATAQLAGAPSPQAAELMAVTLASLGLQKGFVVHGEGGLDEISTIGPSHVLTVTRGAIDHQTITPEDFGVPRVSIEELRGGNIDENRAIAEDVLRGQHGPFRDIVLVNAAAAFVVVSKTHSFKEGVALAAESIDSGAAIAKLNAFVEFTQRVDVAA